MNDIIPAFPPVSFEDLETRLGRIRGAVPLVQIDVGDGVFVTNRSWPMNPEDRARFVGIVKGVEGLPYWEDFNYEVDLMVHYPEKYLSAWISVGITRAIIHLESHHDWVAVRDAAGDSLELGLAIDLSPPYEKLHDYISRVEYVQIMGIPRLGHQGEELDERVYDLIRRVRGDFPDVTIQIDGGVTVENARALLDAGADRLAVGSQIFNAIDPKEVIKDLQNL